MKILPFDEFFTFPIIAIQKKYNLRRKDIIILLFKRLNQNQCLTAAKGCREVGKTFGAPNKTMDAKVFAQQFNLLFTIMLDVAAAIAVIHSVVLHKA
ncbi:hypothetical protein EBB07_19435 [Paenibacillaceae bacterium]|nr:hypothetical protein EBB07_19435 [Paenibacillaceae bacterium]